MCCSSCCSCERPHTGDDITEFEIRALVADVINNFDFTRYGVHVTPIGEPNLDARIETWRVELTEKMIDEVMRAVRVES
jgi:hypothetical protein